MAMSIHEHNNQVATGLEAIAKNLIAFTDNASRSQETHDMVIILRSKMDNVEAFMSKITKQLEDLPTRLDECYARKTEAIKKEDAIALVEERAANRQEVADIKKKVDMFFYWLVGLALAVISGGVFVALQISDKINF
jgi:hypothetical protein